MVWSNILEEYKAKNRARSSSSKGQIPRPAVEAHGQTGALIGIGDFVLATVLGKTTKRIFVAQVISIDSDDTEVTYLKQTGKSSFVFPAVEDSGLVLQQDLLGKIVDIKPDRRGTTWTVPFDILAIQ